VVVAVVEAVDDERAVRAVLEQERFDEAQQVV